MNKNKGLILQKDGSTKWKERANFRIKNRKWLGYSGKIALRIMSAIEDIPGMNQKLLAERAGVSPQQVSKIVKGQENLTLQTIAKFSEILGAELISFPEFKYNQFEKVQFVVGANVTVYISFNFNQHIGFVSINENQFLNNVYTGNQSFSTSILSNSNQPISV
jgi:transcriptional regulator with XRE-family HTH domain